MKTENIKIIRLDDFAAIKEMEIKENPLLRSPFGISREGNRINAWQMNYNRISMFSISHGKNFFGKNEMIFMSVPATETGIKPLSADQPFGWDGKINEYTAELAVWWAFELITENEAAEFMKTHKPVVEFSYFDSDGPGEITVKYNGKFWEIK